MKKRKWNFRSKNLKRNIQHRKSKIAKRKRRENGKSVSERKEMREF